MSACLALSVAFMSAEPKILSSNPSALKIFAELKILEFHLAGHFICANTQTNKQTDRQTDKQKNRQTDKQIERQSDRKKDRQRDRETDRHSETVRARNSELGT